MLSDSSSQIEFVHEPWSIKNKVYFLHLTLFHLATLKGLKSHSNFILNLAICTGLNHFSRTFVLVSVQVLKQQEGLKIQGNKQGTDKEQ